MTDAIENEDRSGFIGASEVAEALGLSPYSGRSPVRLAMEKLGQLERATIDPNLAKWGKALQPVILKAVEDRIGMRVRDTDDPRGHKSLSWLRCRTDGITHSGIIVEAKNYSEARAYKYPTENEPEELPLYDLVQVAAEMACWDAEVAFLAVLFGGRDFRMYRIERDPVFEQEILSRLGQFWSYVQRNVVPPASNSVDTALLYPRHTEGMMRVATPAVESEVSRLAALKAQAKQIEAEMERLEGSIKFNMGAAGQLVAPDGRTIATWKASADTSSFDSKRFRADHPEMADRYTVIRPGGRRFIVKS